MRALLFVVQASGFRLTYTLSPVLERCCTQYEQDSALSPGGFGSSMYTRNIQIELGAANNQDRDDVRPRIAMDDYYTRLRTST